MTRSAKMFMLLNESNRDGRGGNQVARNEMEPAYLRNEGGSGGRNEMRNEGGSGGRNEMREGYGEEMEGRFRDRRGREHYDNGRYAPMRNEMPYSQEMRQESGMRNGYEAENRRGGARNTSDEMMRQNWNPYPMPVYENQDSERKIGFEQPSNILVLPVGNTQSRSGSREMADRPQMQHGFTEEMAEEWVASMQNEDGTKGPHWKMEDVQRLMKQRGIKYDPAEFWAVLNGVYSDYCAVAKKHGVNTMDFYVDFASAWINDKDAVPNKTAMYYECIAK